jgi:hypothetical protein
MGDREQILERLANYFQELPEGTIFTADGIDLSRVAERLEEEVMSMEVEINKLFNGAFKKNDSNS